MGELKLDAKMTAIIILGLIIIFSFAALGITGARTIIGSLLLFFIPCYLLLNKVGLPADEKIIFSFFLGIGLFPSLVYYLGFFVGVRKAIIVVFVILLVMGIIINRKRRE